MLLSLRVIATTYPLMALFVRDYPISKDDPFLEGARRLLSSCLLSYPTLPLFGSLTRLETPRKVA